MATVTSESQSRWSMTSGIARGAEYDAKWAAMAARGESVHGEADFVMRYSPASVLDAGCGTGRVGIELAARGVEVVGVDLDEKMLNAARAKAPDLTWVTADLVSVELGRTFDIVVHAGQRDDLRRHRHRARRRRQHGRATPARAGC